MTDIKLILDSMNDPKEKLEYIHNHIDFEHGSLKEEYPEQLMAIKFINQDDRVLELGSNIGRNSVIIATILDKATNLVTLEPITETYKHLEHNRIVNGLKFHSVNAALSYRKLIQQYWTSIPCDIVLPGFISINTITFQELEKKYNIEFNTLVVDCEGALYYILKDYPDMLNNVTKILVENDYQVEDHKKYLDQLFVEKGFKRIYVEALELAVNMPCAEEFYEVWQK